jgi:hypothetical protein
LYEDWRGDLWMAIITVPSTSFLNSVGSRNWHHSRI